MNHPRSVYTLSYNGSGTPFFSKGNPPLPGRDKSDRISEHHIFLRSGFTTITAETGAPVSPTLQLNGDLGTLNDKQLADIARAELDRLSGANYRSSTVEADPRVAVLGNNAEKIRRFMDIYGGVLNITPLLLNGYDPDFDSTAALTVAPAKNGYRL